MNTTSNSEAVKNLTTQALWYAWGRIDGQTMLHAEGFTTQHGIDFMCAYEVVARDYEAGHRFYRPSILDAFNRFVAYRLEHGVNAPFDLTSAIEAIVTNY